jgi:hypothetical protein
LARDTVSLRKGRDVVPEERSRWRNLRLGMGDPIVR